MTKSKTFWLTAALVSFCAAGFCGYSIYNRLTLHFVGDTLEIRPLPRPVTEAAREAKPVAAPKTEEKTEQQEPKEEPQKVKAVKTRFEYINAAAKSVFISGSFTSWKEVKMLKKSGTWNAEVYILPGNYLYHFTVDGKKTLDAGNPKAAAGESMVEVREVLKAI